MKKILVLFFAAIMCCSVAQAQFHIGAKAGANFSNYVGDNAPHKMNVNYHVGGFVEFGVLGILSVAPEVMFSAQGGTEKVPELHGGDVVYKNAKIKLCGLRQNIRTRCHKLIIFPQKQRRGGEALRPLA